MFSRRYYLFGETGKIYEIIQALNWTFPENKDDVEPIINLNQFFMPSEFVFPKDSAGKNCYWWSLYFCFIL